jgi:hypothetical protein
MVASLQECLFRESCPSLLVSSPWFVYVFACSVFGSPCFVVRLVSQDFDGQCCPCRVLLGVSFSSNVEQSSSPQFINCRCFYPRLSFLLYTSFILGLRIVLLRLLFFVMVCSLSQNRSIEFVSLLSSNDFVGNLNSSGVSVFKFAVCVSKLCRSCHGYVPVGGTFDLAILLMVIAKASLTGNCRRCNVNGSVSSDGVRLNLGVAIFCPTCPLFRMLEKI